MLRAVGQEGEADPRTPALPGCGGGVAILAGLLEAHTRRSFPGSQSRRHYREL